MDKKQNGSVSEKNESFILVLAECSTENKNTIQRTLPLKKDENYETIEFRH